MRQVQVQGQTVLVAGLGVSGAAAARVLLGRGSRVLLTDAAERPVVAELTAAGASWLGELSVAIQVAFFRATRRRVFRMAPLHHHFELAGWTENTVIVRFWLVTAMAVAFGLGLFYADWLRFAGL